MHFSMTVALLGIFSSLTEASPRGRCKKRPGNSTPDSSVVPSVGYEPSTMISTTASSTVIPPMSSIASPSVSSSSVASPIPPSPEDASPVTTSASSIQSSTEDASPATTPASSTSTLTETTASSSSVQVTTSNVASMVAIANAPAATQMCAENAKINLPEWGLVVANFRVEESSVEGTVCTTYNGMVTLENGQAAVNFTADANLVFDESTINDNKFYSNAGLGENMNQQLTSISSIPASYTWSRTNTTDFRGNVAFDFVLAPTSGDRTSSATKEIMMWLHWQGDQQPLAWDNGTKATFDLYGTTWDMYQGINYNLADGAGVELTTILPKEDFGATGSWSGDIMDWMQALVTAGVFTEDYYVTNANAGTEQYWGDSVLESVVALRIDLNS